MAYVQPQLAVPMQSTVSDEGERLQKVLAAAGYGSRRSCDDLIANGRVRVDGEIAILGARVDPQKQKIEVDNAPVASRSGLVHYLLNKPTGVISTADDPQGRPTVLEMVPQEPRVFPVGRLDSDTEGLLILTNDGDLTNRLTHPSFGVDKEYLVHVQGKPSAGALGRLRKGIELEDGVTAPATVGALAPDLLRIVIHEGRNRQVRRMCAAIGHPVIRLVRTRIGPLMDSNLQVGEWRALEPHEVRDLSLATGTGEKKHPRAPHR